MLQGLLYHRWGCPGFPTYPVLLLVLEALTCGILLSAFCPEVRADMQLSHCTCAWEMSSVARQTLSRGGPWHVLGSALQQHTSVLRHRQELLPSTSNPPFSFILVDTEGPPQPPPTPSPTCVWILIHIDVRIDTWCSASPSVRNETRPCAQAWVPVNFSSVNSCLLVSSYSPQMVPISQISLYISMRYLEWGTCSNKLSSLLFTCLSTSVPWLMMRAGSVSAY